MPNRKFPQKAAKKLGVTDNQLKPGLIVEEIGNSYSASLLLGLSAVLEKAKPGQSILLTSYGSGAGADTLSLRTTSLLVEKKKGWKVRILLKIKKRLIILLI